MQRRSLSLFVTLLLLLVHAVPARADETDDYVAAQLRSFKLPGLSLLVIKNGTIDDHVSNYLASAAASWSGTSLRHLLSHTSGIVEEGL